MRNRVEIEINEKGEITSKKCNSCGCMKKLDEFFKGNSFAGRSSNCKECSKKYNKKYRKDNKEKISNQKKKHYKENRELLLNQKKKYNEDNKERLTIYKHDWYERNKNNHSVKGQIWREENRQRKKEKDKEYYLNNKEKYKEHAFNRKARLKDSKGNVTKEQIKEMIKYFDNKSIYSGKEFKNQNECELKDKISKDHIKAIYKGGMNYIWNLVPCTQSENASKRDRELDSWLKRKFGYTEEQIKAIKMKIYEWQKYAYCKYSNGDEPIEYIDI